MSFLKDLGPLCIAERRQGYRVPIAVSLTIGEIHIPAPDDPYILLVPENITYLQQMWDALRMPTRNNLLITGESGSGKTALIRFLGECYRQVLLQSAAKERDPVHATHQRERASRFQTRILTFHENLRRSDITERRHYGEEGEEKTGWNMSDVMDGMITGDWNVLSEINRTGEDVQAEFNEPLENKAKTLHQQVLRSHPDTRFIATINPVKSEGRGIYEGKVMSGEFLNRFTNKVHIRYLPPDQEFEVLKDYGPDIDDHVIDRIISAANDIRRDYGEEHGVVPFPVTTRALIRIIRHLQRFPDDLNRLRSLFWRKAYWLDDRIHPPVAVRLVENLLDLHDIVDQEPELFGKTQITLSQDDDDPVIRIGNVSSPLGPGGPYVPDTVIEEVQQNTTDLEWILKDIVLQENILLIGEAGVGKNKLESYLAHLLRWNLLVIGMSGETRVSDLLTYRSFGEEEAGRTGDTATLGLQALTDTMHRWIIVLDEANKAHQGVLVSFNDLLQDRVVRLPGGVGAAVRASICVNINPNRPPYEVNDFSFDFMDRFSIHTIVHLPADQAALVLKKKYPDADVDFIRDVVDGFYHLHPLYSSGALFEPITMRNEEAAIERGLQYPNMPFNLIDLITASYSPRDTRELNAVRSVLEANGFDRNVLAAEDALLQFKRAWDDDPNSEEKALALAGTYRAIGKPTAALDVYASMLSIHPGRDWLHHLRSAWILLEGNRIDEALSEIYSGFKAGTVIRLNNDEEYRILSLQVKREERRPRISIEAIHTGTNVPALIISHDMGRSISRLDGEYLSSFVDDEGLRVYIRSERRRIVGDRTLSAAVMGLAHLGWAGTSFHLRICTSLISPWTDPVWSGGSVIREIGGGIRLISYPGRGWRLDRWISKKEECWQPVIGWSGGAVSGSGGLYLISMDDILLQIPASDDPYLHLAFDESKRTLYLVLKGEPGTMVMSGESKGIYSAGELCIRVLTPGAYHDEVLSALLDEIYPRLDSVFRFARTLPGSVDRGVGDVIYTLQPDSCIGISLLTGIDGMGASIMDLSDTRQWSIQTGCTESDSLHRQTVIPFHELDAAEERQEKALSCDTQTWLQEVRSYIAAVFFSKAQPRDPAYEAKARAILTGYLPLAEPVTDTILHPGDILVRNDAGAVSMNRPRSVFIVRFIQESSGVGSDEAALVRGFWLAEQNPVATERLDIIGENFSRLIIVGDDRHQRIIRRLAAALQSSSHPWQFSRTGNRYNPLDRIEFGGLIIEYRPMGQIWKLTITADGKEVISIEETGYPTNVTLVTIADREPIRWPGSVMHDIRYSTDTKRVSIVLADDLLSILLDTRTGIGDEPIIGSTGVTFELNRSS